MNAASTVASQRLCTNSLIQKKIFYSRRESVEDHQKNLHIHGKQPTAKSTCLTVSKQQKINVKKSRFHSQFDVTYFCCRWLPKTEGKVHRTTHQSSLTHKMFRRFVEKLSTVSTMSCLYMGIDTDSVK